MNEEVIWKNITAAAVLGGVWLIYKSLNLFSLFYDVATRPVGQPAYARKKDKIETPAAQSPKVLIIGGGPAGIGTAGALNRQGISNIVLEKSSQAASSWRGHYKRLHLHTPYQFSSLPHLPFPSHYPLYVPREWFADYVAGYASMMQVKINYNETVISVVENENDSNSNNSKYTVLSLKQDGTSAIYNVEAVVMCTGENITPLIPSFPDENLYKGLILHSSKYHTAEDFKGKKVLVVGFGNTGCELSIDLYEHGCDVHVLARSPVNIVKRRSLILAPSIIRHLPVWVQLIAEYIVTRLDYGDMHKYGITCPVSSGFKDLAYYRLRKYHEAPVVDIGQIDLIRKKLVHVQKHEIERFTSTGVIFKNGKEEAYDVVILATGFKPNLEQILSKPIFNATITPLGFPYDMATVQKNQEGIFYVGYSDEAGRILKIREDAIATAAAIKKQFLTK